MIRLPRFATRCATPRVSRRLLSLVAVMLVAVAGGPATVLEAQSSGTTPGAVRAYSTITSIGVEWSITGDANHNATATAEFRATGTSTWRAALPLVRVD